MKISEKLSNTETYTQGSSYVYILIFPKIKGFKVGKADNVHQRISGLTRWWGEVDYAESYTIKVDKKQVFRIEKMFHALLDDFRLDFDCFAFYFSDRHGSFGLNKVGCLTTKNNTIYFCIDIEQEPGIRYAPINYLFDQFIAAIKDLPSRSPSLIEDIPPLIETPLADAPTPARDFP